MFQLPAPSAFPQRRSPCSFGLPADFPTLYKKDAGWWWKLGTEDASVRPCVQVLRMERFLCFSIESLWFKEIYRKSMTLFWKLTKILWKYIDLLPLWKTAKIKWSQWKRVENRWNSKMQWINKNKMDIQSKSIRFLWNINETQYENQWHVKENENATNQYQSIQIKENHLKTYNI